MTLKDDLQNLLKKYNLKPNKLLGQNFLIDRAVLAKIIDTADLSKDDVVLEVGPGLGILTQELAKHAGQVIAVEKDKKMAEIVRNILDDKNVRNVKIVEEDILRINPLNPPFEEGQYRETPLVKGGAGGLFQYKLVANIPYYLTSHLIRKFLESENPPQEMILMIQKEVAQRICAKPPKMSLLAVSVQFYAEPKIISYVSKNSFWPSPKVDSTIVRLTPHSIYRNITPPQPSPLEGEGWGGVGGKNRSSDFFRVVRAGFSHPRKQLINNLSQGLKKNRAEIEKILKKIGIDSKQRAETLKVEEWIKLTSAFFE